MTRNAACRRDRKVLAPAAAAGVGGQLHDRLAAVDRRGPHRRPRVRGRSCVPPLRRRPRAARSTHSPRRPRADAARSTASSASSSEPTSRGLTPGVIEQPDASTAGSSRGTSEIMNASMRAPRNRPGRRPALDLRERDALAVQSLDVEALGKRAVIKRAQFREPDSRRRHFEKRRRAARDEQQHAAARRRLPPRIRATHGPRRGCARPAADAPLPGTRMPACPRARPGIEPSGATTSPRASGHRAHRPRPASLRRQPCRPQRR